MFYIFLLFFFKSNLKLENVLLDSYGNCKICDFENSLNCSVEEVGKLNNNNGESFGLHAVKSKERSDSFEYKAPEMYTNNNFIEYSADYWALGILIYKMLTGNFPFLNKASIIADDIPDLKNTGISRAAIGIIKNLLNKNETKRLGSRKNPIKIKYDSFFIEINWKALENLDIEPPFKPNVVKDFK